MTKETYLTESLAPTWVIVLITVAVILAVALIFFVMLKEKILMIVSKTKTVNATLISKIEEPFSTARVYVNSGVSVGGVAEGIAEKGMAYYLSFSIEDGKNLTFQVTKEIYDVAVEEETGTLVYKYKDFISFSGRTEGTKKFQDASRSQVEFVSVGKGF